ncbi:MAG: hypothetical protein LC105_03655 [Chitinophagales bacterium]|nr:hypothetical protein [Chitinophagales bacterium]MCZ2392937.1 hypothetical protein [Chitinophagales bacterium]
MKNYKSLIVGFFLIAIIFIIGYLTYIYRTTGVPFYRHDAVYEIIQSDSNIHTDTLNKNYTEPFKKYGIIGVEEIEQDDYSEVVVPRKVESNELPILPIE